MYERDVVHATDAFCGRVLEREFPCLGAKSAIRRENFQTIMLGSMGDGTNTARLALALTQYIRACGAHEQVPKDFHTFIAFYKKGDGTMSEQAFEAAMWTELQLLHEHDATQHSWASHVSSDPNDADFAYSFYNVAFFIVGLHARSSRLARQFEYPALVFNFHDQFQTLRQHALWGRMQKVVRARDAALQGYMNPELSDHGHASQSRQYSGRRHDPQWRAPFTARCPEAHPPTSDQSTSGCPFHAFAENVSARSPT